MADLSSVIKLYSSSFLWGCIMSSFLSQPCHPCGKTLFLCAISLQHSVHQQQQQQSPEPPQNPHTASPSQYDVSRSVKKRGFTLSYGQLLLKQWLMPLSRCQKASRWLRHECAVMYHLILHLTRVSSLEFLMKIRVRWCKTLLTALLNSL